MAPSSSSSSSSKKLSSSSSAAKKRKNSAPGPDPVQDESHPFYHVWLTIGFSLTAWPVTYAFNTSALLINQNVRPLWMMTLGFVILSLIGYAGHVAGKVKDWLFTGLIVFSFSAMIDLIIGLEFHGVITGFMAEYLKYGEPYLFCTWGTAIMLFDAFGFQSMYLFMVYFLTNGKSWRSVGIHWAAGILHSMIVLLIGALAGQAHTPTFCIFLNVPFVIFPVIVLIRAFDSEKRCVWTRAARTGTASAIKRLSIAFVLLVSIWVTMAKGLAAFGCKGWAVWSTVESERALFLDDPAPFAKIQAIVFLFYQMPVQSACLISLFRKEVPQYMWEVGVAQAGIMLQGQFSYMFLCLSPDTPTDFQTDWTAGVFWVVNLLPVIASHLFLLHLWSHRRRQGQPQPQPQQPQQQQQQPGKSGSSKKKKMK